MGDIAEAIINGDMDSQSGEWLGGGQGFPRTLQRGHPDSIPSYSSKVLGVKKYLKIFAKNIPHPMHYEFCVDYIQREVQPNLKQNAGWETVAEIIQSDFDQFVNFVKHGDHDFNQNV